MKRFHFTDPFPTLPSLERQIVMLRSFEASLCLYYTEELKVQISDMVSTTGRFKGKRDPKEVTKTVKEQKYGLRESLATLVADGAITHLEQQEISALVGFRNDIGHRIDQLHSDLEQFRFRGTVFDADMRSRRSVSEFDHTAVARFDAAFEIINRAARSHYPARTFRHGGSRIFSSSEKVLRDQIKRIRSRIQALVERRYKAIERMNSDFPRAFEILKRHKHSQYNIRFPYGRMTRRGIEICYRLFDANICELVVAQVFEMKLPSIRAKYKAWRKLGGIDRPKIDFDGLPDTIVPSKFYD